MKSKATCWTRWLNKRVNSASYTSSRKQKATTRCWNNTLGWYCWWAVQWPRKCERCGDCLHSKLIIAIRGEFIPKTVQDLKQIAEGKIHYYAYQCPITYSDVIGQF